MTYSPEVDTLHPIGEASRMLGVSNDTLRRWEAAGKITSVRTVGNQRRFPRSEIDRLLAPQPQSAA